MKRKSKLIFLLSFLVVSVAGCFVKSLHSFYHPEDVFFDESFTGVWLDEDESVWYIKKMEDKEAYVITIIDDKPASFTGHLFQLGENLYLDFYPKDFGNNNILEYHLIPTHTIARIERNSENKMVVKWMDQEWIHNMFKQNQIRISHEKVFANNKRDTAYILTASTDELQKFVIKYDLEAYNEEGVHIHLNKVVK